MNTLFCCFCEKKYCCLEFVIRHVWDDNLELYKRLGNLYGHLILTCWAESTNILIESRKLQTEFRNDVVFLDIWVCPTDIHFSSSIADPSHSRCPRKSLSRFPQTQKDSIPNCVSTTHPHNFTLPPNPNIQTSKHTICIKYPSMSSSQTSSRQVTYRQWRTCPHLPCPLPYPAFCVSNSHDRHRLWWSSRTKHIQENTKRCTDEGAL